MCLKKGWLAMKRMNFNAALAVMLAGGSARCSEWKGFWSWDQDAKNIRMHLKDGSSMLLTETEQPLYTFQCIARDDFIDCFYESQGAPVNTFSFSDALRFLKVGKCVARKGWNGKGIFVGAQLPDEHSKMTSSYCYIDTTGLRTDNSHVPKSRCPWIPWQTDMLANDWVLYEA